MVGIRTLGELFDQSLLQQTPDRGVERAGAEPHRARRARGDLLHDRVAVALPVGERNEDVEGVARERERPHGARL